MPMYVAHLRREERIGLGVAAVAHIALFAALAISAARDPAKVPVPERMVVSLAEDVALTSTAPDPSDDSRAAIAPTLSDQPAPVPEPQERVEPPRPTPVPTPVARPQPTATPSPRVTSRPQPSPSPRATARPQPSPSPRPTARPQPSPSPTARATSRPQSPSQPKPQPRATATQAAQPRPAATQAQPQPRPTATQRSGGSRIGSDFLAGQSNNATGNDARVPAAQIGASTKASLFSQIARKIRPHWTPPSGAEAEQLVTVLRFRLNPDGTLAGRPTVVTQRNITDANRPQAARHAELAVRAVQLAAPFDLDEKYYEAWKTVGPIDFDWKLSQ